MAEQAAPVNYRVRQHQVLMTCCGLTVENQCNILINQENFYRIEVAFISPEDLFEMAKRLSSHRIAANHLILGTVTIQKCVGLLG